ncbi:hypothetical protein RISW2_15360 [Roseivivax isoporae LMG 25204]|uniref:Cytochrome b561 bacterial/Ni-hydrogenase domain-containing protein n=1 Tax=Roseivivax isoporae LMG 25204 TaxID=1449351 RepID=X7F527_9RHOB|nr:hypothetical protein RISW2_15360 [Roseivivax isoporae LMG 25204]
MPFRDHYGQTQISLHWLVVALVFLQFVSGEGMARAFESVREGGSWTGDAVVHGWFGSMILVAMLLRFYLRLNRGVPPPSETEPPMIQRISRGTHWAFYAVLVAMPLIGLTAVLTRSALAGQVHVATSWLLLALIAAHVAGAFWHLVRQDGVVARIVYRQRAGAAGRQS